MRECVRERERGMDKERDRDRRIKTHCMIVNGVPRSAGTRGAMVVRPTSPSCSAVLYLLMVVGCTSAEGSEKSQ